MDRTARSRRMRMSVCLLSAAILAACADEARSPVGPAGTLEAAKSGGSTTVSVTATSPSYGSPGESNATVTITGSGFKAGAQAQWLLTTDSVDNTITVASTQFVSSTQLTSVIAISPNSPVAFRNVQVTNADRTKGIGNSVFEVTQAVPVSAVGIFRGANDHGEMTGGAAGVAYWNVAQGLLASMGDSGQGFDISRFGNAIAANQYPRLFTRPGPIGTAWQLTMLPTDAGASGGGAFALLVDSISGQPLIVGGRVKVSLSKKSGVSLPRLWTWQPRSASWQMISLSTGSNGQGTVRHLSANGTAVGWLGPESSCCYPANVNLAAVWQPDGSGGWRLTTIGPLNSGAESINDAGTLIVGTSGGAAVYWQFAGGAWSGPITLPGGCARAMGVDTSGRIAVGGCSSSNPEPAAVLVPPYSASNMMFLGGLGPKNVAQVEAMSLNGTYVVGQGMYWKLP